MRRLIAAAAIVVASLGAIGGHVSAYSCISTFNACKYANDYIKHVNNGIHH